MASNLRLRPLRLFADRMEDDDEGMEAGTRLGTPPPDWDAYKLWYRQPAQARPRPVPAQLIKPPTCRAEKVFSFSYFLFMF